MISLIPCLWWGILLWTQNEMCAKWSFRFYLPINFADNTSFDNVAHLSICTDLTSERLLISTQQFPSQLPQSVNDTYTSSKFQAVYDILENRIPVEEKVTIFVSHSSLVPIFWSDWRSLTQSHFACTLHMPVAGLKHKDGQYFDYTLCSLFHPLAREACLPTDFRHQHNELGRNCATLKSIYSKHGPPLSRVILGSIGAGGSGTLFPIPDLLMMLMCDSGLNIATWNHVILISHQKYCST